MSLGKILPADEEEDMPTTARPTLTIYPTISTDTVFIPIVSSIIIVPILISFVICFLRQVCKLAKLFVFYNVCRIALQLGCSCNKMFLTLKSIHIKVLLPPKQRASD